MELVFLVYVVGLISKLNLQLAPVLAITFGLSCCVAFVLVIHCNDEGKPYIPTVKKYIPYKIMISLLLVNILLPSESTMKYMAGAYVVQQVAESSKVKELGNLSYEAARTQLKSWAKSEDPELASKMAALVEQLERTRM